MRARERAQTSLHTRFIHNSDLARFNFPRKLNQKKKSKQLTLITTKSNKIGWRIILNQSDLTFEARFDIHNKELIFFIIF